LGISYCELIVSHSLKKNKINNMVKIVKDFSYNAVNSVPNELDFIFIDGDHSYEGIKRDWDDWSKKLKIGGIIALHDTNIPEHDPSVGNLGSYKFFNDTIISDTRFTIVETIDSLNILVKK
jgi:predicted O-methyltransferase YrrM